jgi:hypothetical protein
MLALVLSATADAKPGYTVKPKSLHLKIALPASNGYSASIATNGHRQVALKVSKGAAFARYRLSAKSAARASRPISDPSARSRSASAASVATTHT